VLQKFDEAANAFYEGVMLDPENKELVNAFRSAYYFTYWHIDVITLCKRNYYDQLSFSVMV